jgi:phenylacetate 2-hydroxylase
MLSDHCLRSRPDLTRFADAFDFVPERYMSGDEANRALPSYAFGVGRRACPAMFLAHKIVSVTIEAMLEWFTFEIHDGEREFDPVEANGAPYQFNQPPKDFRLKLRVRDEAKLEEYLSTSDYARRA